MSDYLSADMFHDIQVKVRRQDSSYQDVRLGDFIWVPDCISVIWTINGLYGIDFKWSLLHPDYIKNLYPFMMLWWFIRYQITQIMMFYDRAGTWS